MSELLTVAAPIAATILITIFGTIIAPTLRLPRSIRRDLESDAQVLEKLPEPAQSDLKADMGRRATELVAYSQFPSLTRLDLLSGLGIIALAGYSLVLVMPPTTPNPDYVDGETFIGLGLVVSIQTAAWAASLEGWARRVTARLEYLRSHLGEEASIESARMVHTALLFMRVIATLLIPGVLLVAGGIEINHGYSGGFRTFEIIWLVMYGAIGLGYIALFISRSRTPHLTPLLPPFEWVRIVSGPPPPPRTPPDQNDTPPATPQDQRESSPKDGS